jgi:LuxR family maltose regulon positive regulatory protein
MHERTCSCGSRRSWTTRLAASRGRAFVLVVDDVHLLTRPDCHALLRDVLGLLGVPLTGAQADALTARTEGWPVGLHLMTLATQTRGERGWPDSGLPTGSDRFIVDYLRAEVLAGLPEGSREFLRQTSILDELEGPTCDAVLGRNDSAVVLAGLSRQLQLVVPVEAINRKLGASSRDEAVARAQSLGLVEATPLG